MHRSVEKNVLITRKTMMVWSLNYSQTSWSMESSEVKWGLGSITTNKASGDHGIPAKLFKILNDDADKVLHSISQQIWITQRWPQGCKRSVFITTPKKSNVKECSSYQTIVLISHASKVMLKNLHTRLQ